MMLVKMSMTSNSTLEEAEVDGTLGTDTSKYVLVTAIPIALALAIAVVVALVVRAYWRRRQGSKEYRPVPTKDTPDYAHDERVKRNVRKVQIVLPDPPPPRTRVTIATDITKSNSKLPRYLPHKPAGNSRSGGDVGVAAPQAFLCLKMYMDHNRLMVEVQNVVGLPYRVDGSPVDPFVKLNVVSREKKQLNRKSSSTHEVPVDPEFMQTVDCGPMVREELERSILHIEV